MPWEKRGLIFKPTGEWAWSQSHAQVPTALVLDRTIRIYYATRDAEGHSSTSFVEVDRHKPSRVVYVHAEPIAALGAPGAHDEDGVMVGCVVPQGERVLLYYTGWSRGVRVPYRVSVGLLISEDGGRCFSRYRVGPVLDRTPDEPYMTMSPYVLRDEKRWRMWYGSGHGWVEVGGKMEPLYAIKYAESLDGLCWSRPNTLCIAPLDPREANTRPSVLVSSAGYEMWFSYRGSDGYREGRNPYRIGHAMSPDGLNWHRLADADGLAGEDWCKTMQAYPNVVVVDGQRLMFYNGDGFGRSGFGLAVWREP